MYIDTVLTYFNQLCEFFCINVWMLPATRRLKFQVYSLEAILPHITDCVRDKCVPWTDIKWIHGDLTGKLFTHFNHPFPSITKKGCIPLHLQVFIGTQQRCDDVWHDPTRNRQQRRGVWVLRYLLDKASIPKHSNHTIIVVKYLHIAYIEISKQLLMQWPIICL